MYSNSTEWIPMILSGLGTNVLIVILSSILPLVVGIGLTVLMHYKRKTALPKVFRYVSILTEGIVPLVLLNMVYYEYPKLVRAVDPSFLHVEPTTAALMALSVCFMGYMVFRYDERDSLVKNLVVNGIGLFADLFKWCFSIVAFIGVDDMIRINSWYLRVTPRFGVLIPALIIGMAILIPLYIGRQLCKDFMK